MTKAERITRAQAELMCPVVPRTAHEHNLVALWWDLESMRDGNPLCSLSAMKMADRLRARSVMVATKSESRVAVCR